MSHFTVLVPAKDDQDLKKRLQPFHEYECTGIDDQYVVDVDVTDDVKNDYEKYGNGEPIAEFAEEWGGYFEKDGRFYRHTNPNAKWDWYQIGGRYTGKLILKEANMGRNGSPGLMTEPNHDPKCADIALAGDVDWQKIHDNDVERQIQWHRRCNAAIKKAEEETDLADFDETWDQIMEQYNEEGFRGEKRREIWDSPLKYAQYEAASSFNDPHYDFFMITWDQIASIYWDEKKFKASIIGKAQTYAAVDLDGNWIQRGEMGWFGMDDPEKGSDNYDEKWWQLVKSIPEDMLVYVVDCHI